MNKCMWVFYYFRLNCHHFENDSSSISHYPLTESSSVQQGPSRVRKLLSNGL